MTGTYFVIFSSVFIISLLSVFGSEEQTISEDCGCSATSRKQSSVVVSDDKSSRDTPTEAEDTPTESQDTPPCASGQDEKRPVATGNVLIKQMLDDR